jgi:glycerol uptake facilitator-like aquaporin
VAAAEPGPLDLGRRTAVEAVGTALLLATVVGSGIMGERLAGGNVAIALLANTLATGAILIALVAALGPLSGAHLNPVVTLSSAVGRELAWRDVPAYVGAQLVGAFAGAGVAHVMFGMPLFSASHHARAGLEQVVSEAVATFGLLVVIATCARRRPAVMPFAVGAYIAAAYWFTSSTSFANPAATLARAASDTFAGIRPSDVGGFIGAQLVGAVAAVSFARWLFPRPAALPAQAQEKLVA